MRTIMLLLFLSQIAQAQTKTNLFLKPQVETKTETKSKSVSMPSKKKNAPTQDGGNLPSYFSNRSNFHSEDNPVILPTNRQSIKSNDFNSGDVIEAEILESLIAFSETKAPIRAIIRRGPRKGSILIGEATLERNSKRILIEFKKLRTENNNQLWNVQAYTLDSKGILGLEGKLISGEDKYFAAEFLSAAAAGYADATINRSQNALGNYVEQPGTDTFAKKALSSALSKTTDRFAEKLKSFPEYAILEGPLSIQVLITEQPKLTE